MDERSGETIARIVDEAATFAEMVDRAAKLLELNDYQLSGAIGLLPGKKVISSRQVGRLRAGEQRNYDRALVARLIEVLGLNPDSDTELKVWRAADRWPPGLDPEELISELLATRGTAAGRVASLEGARSAAPSFITDQRKGRKAYFGVLPARPEAA